VYRRKFILLTLLTPVLLLFPSGCATQLNAPAGEKAIAEGQTTYKELLAKYGKPKIESRGSSGQRLVTFHQTKFKKSSSSLLLGAMARDQGTLEFRILDVLFTPEDVVKKYLYYDTDLPVRSRKFRVEVGAPIDEEKIKHISKGKTSQSELIKLLDQPGEKRLNIDGDLILVWIFGTPSRLPGNQTLKLLQVTIGDDEVVKDFSVVEKSR
jgi:hypothetical protein